MKLIIKFNLVLLLVFAIGFVVEGYFSNRLLQRNAKQEILENARIMMEAALAVRAYTNTQIKPLLETQLKYSFLPQSVPAYSANEYFNKLRKTFPDYSYKEATLNPTNPVNRATDWEADIIRYFRQTPNQTEEVGERDTPNGRVLYMARAMKIKDAKCLFCHDTPDLAPRTLIDRYGSANGFGWKLNDVITVQIVSAPMQLPIQRARTAFTGFMVSVAAVFAAIFLALNAMLVLLVTRPVQRLSTSPTRSAWGTWMRRSSSCPATMKSRSCRNHSAACARAWPRRSRCWKRHNRPKQGWRGPARRLLTLGHADILQEARTIGFGLHMLGKQEVKRARAVGALCRPFGQNTRDGANVTRQHGGGTVDDLARKRSPRGGRCRRDSSARCGGLCGRYPLELSPAFNSSGEKCLPVFFSFQIFGQQRVQLFGIFRP